MEKVYKYYEIVAFYNVAASYEIATSADYQRLQRIDIVS